ncbi:MAG: DNA-binding protein WhiA [Ruminococcaceae bacterium]|nr:DNA-binding protein WhiA [Oscillospiraceae bacterium]
MPKITFSQEVKDELCEVKIKREEALAELAAMLLFGENILNNTVTLKTEHANVAARIQLVFKKAIDEEVFIDLVKGRKNYSISIPLTLAENAGVYFSEDGEIALDEDIYESEISKRAFLRGAFIISGTITEPKKGYSCELITYNENMAYLSSEMLESFDIRANTVKRNNYYVTYLKDKNSVNDFLNIIGAHKLMLDLMVTQIEKDINNRENRALNCKTANMDRTISASVFQCKAIMKLQELPIWDEIDDLTKQLAKLRLENFDLSLTEIGERMSPPMTKSSVNRRMKKLIDLAEDK